jgi:hypothetical protein
MALFTDFFVASDGQTTFETSKEYSPINLNVYRNGIKLTSNTDVIITSGIFVELISPASSGDEIVITGVTADGESPEVYSGPSFMDRLGFDFNVNKFGKALTVNGLSESFYSANPYKLKPWQKELIKTSDYTGYYQNPLTETINDLKNEIIKIRDVAREVIIANTPKYVGGSLFAPPTKIDGAAIPQEKANANVLQILVSSSNTLIASLTQFKSHTDRISGVTISDSEDPDYQKAITVGTTIAYYANSIDGVKDFSPILGSFTSLFVKDEMITYLNNLDNLTGEKGYRIDSSQWSNSNYYTANTGVNVGVLLFTANDSSNLSQTINTISSFVETRRLHDKNYFQKSTMILSEYTKILSLTNIQSPAAIVLLRDLIGTDKLKELL